MEAKDTVISQKEIDIIDEGGVIDGDIVPYLNRQAEISFKAGLEAKEKSSEDRWVEDESFVLGKQAGIKEVVEWIKASGYIAYKGFPYEDDKKVWEVLYSDWQAKLKEWGLRNGLLP